MCLSSTPNALGVNIPTCLPPTEVRFNANFNQVSPAARPLGKILMRAAAGTLGNPGIVKILPQTATTKPASAAIC